MLPLRYIFSAPGDGTSRQQARYAEPRPEEVEWIHTGNPLFTTYLAIVAAMLEHQANMLYVGPALHSLEDSATLKRRMSRVWHLQVSNRDAATMFFLNIQSWKSQPFVQQTYSYTTIDELEESLHALSGSPGRETEIEWGLRQLAFERV